MAKLAELLGQIADEADTNIPPLARGSLLVLARQLQELQLKIGEVARALHAWHRSNEISRRLETIPGIGPITASALAVAVTDPTLFRSGRHLAARDGLLAVVLAGMDRSLLRSMAWARAPTELKRWQGAAWGHLQAG